jgi:hypothetical protein
MIIRLQCVMMDGTAPAEGDPLVPYVQHLDGDSVELPTIPAGVDVSFEFDFVGQDGEPFDMTGYGGIITARRSSRSADPIFANQITFDAATGTSFSTHADTKDEKPRTCVYDVQVVSPTSKVDQPIPESHFKIVSSITDTDEPATAAGPSVLLGGGLVNTAVKTSAYTAVVNDRVLVDPSGGAFAVTLPTAVGIAGQSIGVKNVTDSENAVTISHATQTIDGDASYTLNTSRAFVTLVSDGANWMVA